eukprot:TRINITY_DN6509_c0_g1_i1.p1 TRINITY_DN6509_c0_g1~~TRINITY_DN6509_c0_g1_i1.p1  ORF type:complete len:142 (-),score=48.20 TRINITY_DN6509_c0_g1_i1:246-671(-)
MMNGPITEFMTTVVGTEVSEFLLSIAVGLIVMYWCPALWRAESKGKKVASYEPETLQPEDDEDQEEIADNVVPSSADLDRELDAMMEGAMKKFYSELPGVQAEARGYYPMQEVPKQELVAKAIAEFEAEDLTNLSELLADE